MALLYCRGGKRIAASATCAEVRRCGGGANISSRDMAAPRCMRSFLGPVKRAKVRSAQLLDVKVGLTAT
jgi:hypothetical protein